MPTEEFAKGARELCDRTGALLIVDDVRAGFRFQRSQWQPAVKTIMKVTKMTVRISVVDYLLAFS